MNMIEKVAKAIYDNPDTAHLMIGQASAKNIARAAIEAMREPSEEMLKACSDGTGHVGWLFPEDCWQSSIDAALKE